MFSMTETGHFLRSFAVVDILVVNFLDFVKTVRLNTKVTVPECEWFLYGLISNSWFTYQERNV